VGSDQREIVQARLERIHGLAERTGFVARFIVFGSFVTGKSEPNDVDIFLLMDDGFDVAAVAPEPRAVFDHAEADTVLGASVFWMRRIAAFGGEQAAIEFWRTRRDGGLRGIVEIIKDPS
jgi:hypothetical protein